MLLPLLPLFAALDAQAEPPLLGRLFQARIDVHEMGRAELTEALSERGTTYGAQESEDVLRIRLYQARAALLDSRSAHLAHAERVMNEATEHSTFEFLSGNTLDTILAARQHVEKRCPGGATAHAPGLLRRPLQAAGCATHTGRAAETLRAQWQAAARPSTRPIFTHRTTTLSSLTPWAAACCPACTCTPPLARWWVSTSPTLSPWGASYQVPRHVKSKANGWPGMPGLGTALGITWRW